MVGHVKAVGAEVHADLEYLDSLEAHSEEGKGTGYFSGVFGGRPCGRREGKGTGKAPG